MAFDAGVTDPATAVLNAALLSAERLTHHGLKVHTPSRGGSS